MERVVRMKTVKFLDGSTMDVDITPFRVLVEMVDELEDEEDKPIPLLNQACDADAIQWMSDLYVLQTEAGVPVNAHAAGELSEMPAWAKSQTAILPVHRRHIVAEAGHYLMYADAVYFIMADLAQRCRGKSAAAIAQQHYLPRTLNRRKVSAPEGVADGDD